LLAATLSSAYVALNECARWVYVAVAVAVYVRVCVCVCGCALISYDAGGHAGQ
jgi:hypothetical protein